jgi:hypothetical protein
MAVCPTDSAVYQETIKTITFRGDDGITIPKLVREAAFELAIDVIIRSVARETYKNYECTPSESFYGTAVVVSQDACELKVPIKFPRQRIYYGRVSEAFEQWNALIVFETMRAYFLAVGESIASLGAALGTGVIPAIFCCSLPEPTWRELSIREAYFNVPFGTQYEVEISWLAPVPFSDSCDTFYEGLSGQVDGDKDGGLPAEGIAPNVARDPNNPFDFLPPASPDSEQGAWSNSKTANIDDVDPDNEANLPTEGNGTYIVYGWTPLEGTPNVPPPGFPTLAGQFLFDATESNIYSVGDRCPSNPNGYEYFRNGTLVGCAQASGYRLDTLSFPRFFT